MDTNRLKQFTILVEMGSMRKAAELLHISHGGLSKSIKRLESDLDATLIVPDGRGIAITELGQKIYRESLAIIQLTAGLLAVTKGVKQTPVENIRIGTFEVFSTYFLAPLVSQYLSDVHLLLREFAPGKLEQALIDNEVDFGITYLPIPRAGIKFIKIREIEMGIFKVKGSFANYSSVEELPFAIPVVPVEGSPTGIKGLDGWPDHLFPRKIRYEVELMESGLQLCRLGKAAVFIPKFIGMLHNEIINTKYHLQLCNYPKGIATVKREVYLVTRNVKIEDKVERNIAKAIRNIERNSK